MAELGDDAINDLIQKRLSDNESFLKRHSPFADFEDWPADAQLAVLSMAWAMGAGGVLGFSKFCAACSARRRSWSRCTRRLIDFGNRPNSSMMSRPATPIVSRPAKIATASIDLRPWASQ